MKRELPKAYEPSQYEDGIYKKWEKSGLFNPDNLDGEPYSIMMPPPNVTGVLHIGHALENSLMDIMARYQRMNGKKVLLLPGTDHAAVATQAKVEKILIEQGVKNPRKELGREKLLEKIREYSEDSKSTILKQIKKMGTSCDWSRLVYTFDEERNKAVNEVFIRMYKDGLIYRGHRVINWSVKGQSTCSDDELVYIERPAKLYTFKYSKDFPIPIATTRPETKLGDTAVAVNPKDKRYKKYIGKTYKVDIGAEKPLKIKIIADVEIDQKFGTGAVGVTPAHSVVDFEMYEKQKAKKNPIDLIQVIDQNGLMNERAGKVYKGLKAEVAREKFVTWLKKEKLLIKEENISQNVGTSDRFGDIVEAIPMTQWFVNVNKKIPGKGKSLKEQMKEAVSTGLSKKKEQKIKITPDRYENIYYGWIDNLRDWCISRQIWWGHRIPVWYNGDEIYVGSERPKGKSWTQDPDTLDTWFSSGLWTFSSLGWPDKTKDLKTFHPTSWMQMGYEILFFWMARMILMSTYTLDEIPFKDVYIHGMVRNESGKKFSKSSGNNLDPLEVIEQYGTDALRYSLIIGTTPGNDSRFYEQKVEDGRNLVNKIWNISRYILQTKKISLNQSKSHAKNKTKEINLAKCTLADKWILENMRDLIKDVSEDLNEYKFSQAGEKLREFTWSDFADWYLEVSKFEKNKEKDDILNYILENLLKLWHPFMPFVTEKIWGELSKDKMIIIEEWPINTPLIKGAGGINFELIVSVIKAIRNARAENKIEPSKKIEAFIYAGKNKKFIESQVKIIKNLRTGINNLDIYDSYDKSHDKSYDSKKAIKVIVGDIEIYLINARDKEKEKERIKKEIENLEKVIKNVKIKLDNKEFVSRAPKKVVDIEKDKLKKADGELKKLRSK